MKVISAFVRPFLVTSPRAVIKRSLYPRRSPYFLQVGAVLLGTFDFLLGNGVVQEDKKADGFSSSTVDTWCFMVIISDVCAVDENMYIMILGFGFLQGEINLVILWLPIFIQ